MMVFFASCLPVIILMCGLGIDVGILQVRKLQMQTAADAAAIGAELEVERGTGNWAAQGKLDAGVNGFTDGVNNVTVTVVEAANYSDYSGYYDTVQATVTAQYKTLFMAAWNGGKVTMTTTATALVPPCHYYMNTAGLDPNTGNNALYLASAHFYSVCPVYDANAIGVDGFAQLDTFGTNVTGAASASYIPGSASPTPRYLAATVADPLASVTLPTFSGSCKATSVNYTSSQTISPGNYCKGLSITGTSSAPITITFNPGLYVITAGSTWKYATLTGTGVTLFFTKGSTAAEGNTYGQLSATSTNINLSAPATSSNGSLATIVIANDRNWVHTSTQDFSFTYCNVNGDGIWYITGTGIYQWGSNSDWTAPNYFAMVVDNAYFYYTTLWPQSDFSAIPTGNPFRKQSVLVQ
jgi:hypothetical protein